MQLEVLNIKGKKKQADRLNYLLKFLAQLQTITLFI